jgi:hypothetical protein
MKWVRFKDPNVRDNWILEYGIGMLPVEDEPRRTWLSKLLGNSGYYGLVFEALDTEARAKMVKRFVERYGVTETLAMRRIANMKIRADAVEEVRPARPSKHLEVGEEKCPACGKMIPAGSKYCPFCGVGATAREVLERADEVAEEARAWLEHGERGDQQAASVVEEPARGKAVVVLGDVLGLQESAKEFQLKVDEVMRFLERLHEMFGLYKVVIDKEGKAKAYYRTKVERGND